jgi:hypothetical protein
MATLYHGTTLENWEQIKAEGWNGDSRVTVWNCSCNEVYFHDLAKHDDQGDWLHDAIVGDALSSAQAAAAVQNYMGETLVVLRFEIDDEYIEDDWSCENMNTIASVVQPEDMQHATLTGEYHSDDYNPAMRLFYVCGLIVGNNHYIRTEKFSDLEHRAMEAIAGSGVYIDELHSPEWHTYDEIDVSAELVTT